jgi:amidohydrolase
MDKQEISKQIQAILDEIIGFRRYIHQHPELSFEEYETATFVEQKLAEWGIVSKRMAKTGVVATIYPNQQENTNTCIAFRADLDALPIQEETYLPYASQKKGIMHACGHDVHTAILLGVAKLTHQNKANLLRAVKFIFQPGEEKLPGGASLMIEEGVLTTPKVEQIFALHVFPELASGKIGVKSGMYMASTDEIYITVEGKGGHGAMPHQNIDPVLIGSAIVLNLQQIVSRKCDPKIPSVLSFGRFEALGASNVIPDVAYLQGTFRTMDEKWRQEAHQLIEAQVQAIAQSYGGNAHVEIKKGYPFLVNDFQSTLHVQAIAGQLLGEDQVIQLPIRMTAEDFSFYSQNVPACFFRLGVRNEEIQAIYGVHNSKFAVDENAIETGMKIFLGIVFAKD